MSLVGRPYTLDADAAPATAVLGQGMAGADATSVAAQQTALAAGAFRIDPASVVVDVLNVALDVHHFPFAGNLRIDWGDGTRTLANGIAKGAAAQSFAHDYPATGVYTVGLSLVPTVAPVWPKSSVKPEVAGRDIAVGWPPAAGSLDPLEEADFLTAHPPR